MKFTHGICAITLAASAALPAAWAQTTPAEAPKPPMHVPACPASTTDNVHTFYLHNVSQPAEANEIYTALRNMLPPDAKSYLTPSENTIMICAGPDQIALAQKMLTDLDRPKKDYRLTYTVTEMDGGKRVSSEHYTMVVAPNQSMTLKQGSKVPIATGSYTPDTSSLQTQFTYLDIGMAFDATLTSMENGVSLKTNIEQSSIADEKSGVGPQDPIVRQVSLKSISILTPGKQLMLGSLDIPNSTRRLDIEVMAELLP
jgi:type II secretory pathway component GspD/PulD (secretin)